MDNRTISELASVLIDLAQKLKEEERRDEQLGITPIRYRRARNLGERARGKSLTTTFSPAELKEMREFLFKYAESYGLRLSVAQILRMLIFWCRDNKEMIDITKYIGM